MTARPHTPPKPIIGKYSRFTMPPGPGSLGEFKYRRQYSVENIINHLTGIKWMGIGWFAGSLLSFTLLLTKKTSFDPSFILSLSVLPVLFTGFAVTFMFILHRKIKNNLVISKLIDKSE